jgi:hypothetical protein
MFLHVIDGAYPYAIRLPVLPGSFNTVIILTIEKTMQDHRNHQQTVPPVNPVSTRQITLLPNSCLTQEIIDGLDELFNTVPPQQLKQDILEIFLLFLAHDPDTPGSFKNIASDYYLLFQFLDKADKAIETFKNTQQDH